jgi:hypothetical protein
VDIAPELVKPELVPEPEQTEQPQLRAVPDVDEPQEELIDGKWKSQNEKDAYIKGQADLKAQYEAAQQEYRKQQQAAQRQQQAQTQPPDYWRELRQAYVDSLKAEAALAQEANDPYRPVAYSYEQTVKTAMALAEKMVDSKLERALSGVVEKLNEQDAESFFKENPHLAPVKSQIRKLVEEHGAPASLVTEIVKAVRPPEAPKQQANDWDDFIESPAPNIQQIPKSLRKLEDEIVKAQREGDFAKRNALMERRWKK